MTLREIYDAVMAYDEDAVAELVAAEIRAGTDLRRVLDEGMVAALDEIGQRFSDGTLFVPEMLMAAEAMQAGLDVLRPKLAASGIRPVATLVIGTVKGDLHDIGKNLVAMMMEGAGFRIIDLGTDVDPDRFIQAAHENDADIVALSGLLTTSMPEMARAVQVISAANQTSNLNVKVMVGGPPVNQEFADTIGADGYGADAPAAVRRARQLVA